MPHLSEAQPPVAVVVVDEIVIVVGLRDVLEDGVACAVVSKVILVSEEEGKTAVVEEIVDVDVATIVVFLVVDSDVFAVVESALMYSLAMLSIEQQWYSTQ